MRILLCFLFLSCLSRASLAQGIQAFKSQGYTVLENEHYGPDERQVFDLLMPVSDKVTPLVIYLHGGGFVAGDKSEAYGWRKQDVAFFLKNGVAVATVNYRYARNNDSLGVKRSLGDIQTAIQYLRHHAGRYHIDKQAVGCFGTSAGAGSSLYFGLHPDFALPGDSSLHGESTRFLCIGAIETQATYHLFRWMDFVPHLRTLVHLKKKDFYRSVAHFYGYPDYAAFQPQREAITRSLDMLAMVSPDDPPVYVMNLTKARFPKDYGVIEHHRGHVSALAKQLTAQGVEHLAYAPGKHFQQESDAAVTPAAFMLTHLNQPRKPRVAAGRVQRFTQFPSRFVAARNVDVWLPDDYSPRKKYDVLYLHDGQMLFDSTVTWNKQEWQFDETLGRLSQSGRIRDCIAVAVWNSGSGRHADYFPQKPFESLSAAQKEALYSAARNNGYSVFGEYTVHSDDYLKFLTQELKPFIDQRFSTHKGPAHTMIAGSSMGGLISMYALCEYPGVFGGAACLSTHWPGVFSLENNPVPQAFLDYLKTHLPKPGAHKFYFDHGSVNLDAWYAPFQQQADEILRAGGYTARDWQTRVFPGEDHAERSWAKRLDIPLLFLLGREPSTK